MLAPPEARSRQTPRDAAKEIEDLRDALRESRLRLRRGAWESARQISRLDAEVTRLQASCDDYRRQLERYESGVVLLELGRELMHGAVHGDSLDAAGHRLAALQKSLAAACDECRRLVAERDALARELGRLKSERSSAKAGD